MRLTPCEIMLWDRLPAIRRAFAISLINDHGLSQRDAAEKLGVTPAAVCQYLSKKRGHNLTFTTTVQQEILISAQHIMNDASPATETCRICRLIQDQEQTLTPAAKAPRAPRARP